MSKNKYDTEDKIEAEVERMQNRLDKEYMNSDMSEEEYKCHCEEISYWADVQWLELHHG